MVCAVELSVVFYSMVSSLIDFMRQFGDINAAPILSKSIKLPSRAASTKTLDKDLSCIRMVSIVSARAILADVSSAQNIKK